MVRTHHCHATNCNIEVPPEMWGCKKHWFMLPKNMRNAIWQTYRIGQCDDFNPSIEYLLNAKTAVMYVAMLENIKPDTSIYDTLLKRKNAKISNNT